MAGLYIHIPFCKQACSYCNFHFSTFLKLKPLIIEAIKGEILLQKNFFKGKPTIETIYFGGGTPSLLSIKEINSVLDVIIKHFSLSKEMEVTFEANPENLTSPYLKDLLNNTLINRLSIGVQSFFNEDLDFMNRSHNGQEAYKAIKEAQNVGFANITCDLIYGTPTLPNQNWEYNLNTMIDLDILHLSCYGLTAEPNTALTKNIAKGKIAPLKDENMATQFEIMISMLQNAAYEHYEISNFARKKMYSKHNTSYWFNAPYLGVGPGAHSYNGLMRFWNVSNNSKYIAQIQSGCFNPQKEKLSEKNSFNEYIMTRIRTMWGIHLDEVENLFGSKRSAFLYKALKSIKREWVQHENDTIKLTSEGKLFSDFDYSAINASIGDLQKNQALLYKTQFYFLHLQNHALHHT